MHGIINTWLAAGFIKRAVYVLTFGVFTLISATQSAAFFNIGASSAHNQFGHKSPFNGTVILAADIQPSLQLELDESSFSNREARVRSNAPFTLYAVGFSSKPIVLLRWSEASREFVVPLRSTLVDDESDAAGAAFVPNAFYTVTHH